MPQRDIEPSSPREADLQQACWNQGMYLADLTPRQRALLVGNFSMNHFWCEQESQHDKGGPIDRDALDVTYSRCIPAVNNSWRLSHAAR